MNPRYTPNASAPRTPIAPTAINARFPPPPPGPFAISEDVDVGLGEIVVVPDGDGLGERLADDVGVGLLTCDGDDVGEDEAVEDSLGNGFTLISPHIPLHALPESDPWNGQ